MGERLFCFVTCFLTLGFVSFLKVNDFFWKSFTNLDLVKNMELYGAENFFGNKHTVAFCDFQKKKVFFICDFKNQARQQKFLPQKLKKNLRKKFWVELQHQSVRKNFLGYTPVKVTNVELISQSLISSGTQSELQKQQHICCFFLFLRNIHWFFVDVFNTKTTKKSVLVPILTL